MQRICVIWVGGENLPINTLGFCEIARLMPRHAPLQGFIDRKGGPLHGSDPKYPGVVYRIDRRRGVCNDRDGPIPPRTDSPLRPVRCVTARRLSAMLLHQHELEVGYRLVHVGARMLLAPTVQGRHGLIDAERLDEILGAGHPGVETAEMAANPVAEKGEINGRRALVA